MNREVEAQILNFETDIEGITHRLPLETYPNGGDESSEKVKKERQSQRQDEKVHARKWVEPRVPPRDLLRFFDMNVWHRRCIKIKAALICGLGWELITDDENKSQDTDYKRIFALLDRPGDNPIDTFTDINIRFMTDYLSLGNGYLEGARNLKQEVANLYHTRGSTVRRDRELKNGGYWQGVQDHWKKNHFNSFGRKLRPELNEILHYYTYDPTSDYYGIAEWYPALADMLMDRSIAEYYISLFNNQLMAKFAVIVEGGKLSAKALKSVKDFIKHKGAGILNAGQTLYLNSETQDVKIKIEKLNVDFGRDSYGISNLRGENRDFVISAHGVPPRMVGIVSSGQLGGGGEVSGQLRTFKETEINPEQARLETFYNNTVLASFGDHKWKLKFNELDITDRASDADYWERALNPQTGWGQRAEAREDQGFPAEEQEPDPAVQVITQLPGLRQQLEGFRKALEIASDYTPEL